MLETIHCLVLLFSLQLREKKGSRVQTVLIFRMECTSR